MRSLQDELEILSMCEPIRDHQGGIWMGRNEQFADATFVDYGACRAFARAARALPDLVKALEEIVNPVQAIQDRAKASGDDINGEMAIRLARDPEYLREIARKALAVSNGDGE